jgi:hypothetical protein
MQPFGQSQAEFVVEMVGDPGPPTLQHRAAENTEQPATVTGAAPPPIGPSAGTPAPQARRSLTS